MAEKLYYPAMSLQEVPSPPPGVLVTGHFREGWVQGAQAKGRVTGCSRTRWMEEDCTEGQGPTFSPVQAMSCCWAQTPLTITLCHRVVLGSSCGPISNPGWSGSSGGTHSSAVKDPACRTLRPLEPGSGQGGLS